MTLLAESLPSIVDRLTPHEAVQYLLGRSDMLEVRYQALMAQRELVEVSARRAERQTAFMRSVGRVIDRAIAEDTARTRPRSSVGPFGSSWSQP